MKLFHVPITICVHLSICRLRGPFQLRPIGDVTEAEIHQAADVEVMELHRCE